jgi:hypothetical protein
MPMPCHANVREESQSRSRSIDKKHSFSLFFSDYTLGSNVIKNKNANTVLRVFIFQASPKMIVEIQTDSIFGLYLFHELKQKTRDVFGISSFDLN